MRFRFLPLVLAALVALPACRDAKVTSYRVPKEQPEPLPPILTGGVPMPSAGSDMAASAVPTASGDDLIWTAPAAWQAKPASAMRKGSFNVRGANGAEGDLSVTAFPGDVGGVLANVNRWRAQAQLPPVTDADLPAATSRLEVGGLTFIVVDAAESSDASAKRILGALVPYNGATWFFKLTGPSALVGAAKPDFLAFLQSVKPMLTGGTPMPPAAATGNDMAATAVPTASGDDLIWTAPAAWQAKPASAMRKGSFNVPGANGAEGDMSVTAFPGDVGGVLANVNRWRAQASLPPIGDGDLPAATSRLEVRGLTFIIVDATDSSDASAKRILAALVPYNGATWFFKLTGPSALVGAAKPDFLAFLQSVKTATPERATQ